ncbi:MAG: hypothetical protein ABI855_01695 [Bacteroidota bacterium]
MDDRQWTIDCIVQTMVNGQWSMVNGQWSININYELHIHEQG